MYGQAHAGLGWMVGVLTPGSDRRLRVWCTTAAILPDVDALVIVFGPEAYDRWHHTFGHNVFLGALCTAAAAWHHRDRPWSRILLAAFLTGACFASHLLTDMKFSSWTVRPWWPVSGAEYQFVPNYGLGHVSNMILVYGLMGSALVLPFIRPVTPLEILSVGLNRIVMNCFLRKPLGCGTCERACNNRCDRCGASTCMRHGKVDWRFRITCTECARAPG